MAASQWYSGIPPINTGSAISIFAAPGKTHIVARTDSNWWFYQTSSTTTSVVDNLVLPAGYTSFL
jgi:hypothetical protein